MKRGLGESLMDGARWSSEDETGTPFIPFFCSSPFIPLFDARFPRVDNPPILIATARRRKLGVTADLFTKEEMSKHMRIGSGSRPNTNHRSRALPPEARPMTTRSSYSRAFHDESEYMRSRPRRPGTEAAPPERRGRGGVQTARDVLRNGQNPGRVEEGLDGLRPTTSDWGSGGAALGIMGGRRGNISHRGSITSRGSSRMSGGSMDVEPMQFAAPEPPFLPRHGNTQSRTPLTQKFQWMDEPPTES